MGQDTIAGVTVTDISTRLDQVQQMEALVNEMDAYMMANDFACGNQWQQELANKTRSVVDTLWRQRRIDSAVSATRQLSLDLEHESDNP